MPLPPLPTGLPAAWDDLRAFAAAVRFARPGLLALLAVPVAVAGLRLVARGRRRVALGRLGDPAAVAALVVGPRAARIRSLLPFALGWLCLVVGAAGPMWGAGDDAGAAVGRDVVVVLDLSRSMLAEDMLGPPARWRAAVVGATDLVEFLRTRGGHRAAVVVFAARPLLLVPLTTDADHLREALAGIDGANPPAEIRPGDAGPASGTRIGAGLRAAVAAHDSRFRGAQDIILVSDGDDPADDREWAGGVSAARAAGIPVHVAGVGDPARESAVVVNGQPLAAPGPGGEPSPVRTRLRDDVLREISTEGRGEYLPARRGVPKLGEFFRTAVEPNPSRELADDAVPRPRDRSTGFLAAAALLFAWGWLGGRRP